MVTMTCNRCGSAFTTADVAEAVRWDVSHDEVCPVTPEARVFPKEAP